MKCILIFDHLNDIIYSKYNKKFSKHIQNVAKLQGLIEDDKASVGFDNKISTNIIMQIFSPIVTSQRIMACQFGNSYTSVQCQHNLNITFDEYMGYLFVHIGTQNVPTLKRSLGVCITIVRHLCGPDVSMLKNNRIQTNLLSRLIDTWSMLRDVDQAVLVEAVEQLMVNADLGSVTLKALQNAVEKLKSQGDITRTHAMVLVENKFLSLYSSKNAQELSAADIMFLSFLCASSEPVENTIDTDTDTEESDEYFSPSSSLGNSPAHSQRTPQPEHSSDVSSYLVLLMGTGPTVSCIPHVVHIAPIIKGVNLILLIEVGNNALSTSLYEAFHYLNVMQNVQMQKDCEMMRPAYENLDISMKKIVDCFKKTKNLPSNLEKSQKSFNSRWDFMKKKYTELLKTGDPDCILKIEASTLNLTDNLKEIFHLTSLDSSAVYQSIEYVNDIGNNVRQKMDSFSDFLKVKALRNFTLGSRASLTINKYLEEFPGLVHFLYIDRTNHRITAPSLDFTSEETVTLTKNKIWKMVDFVRNHVQDGHLAFMWKDTTFNYAYFLWFEDSSGAPLKPKVFPTSSTKPLPVPGIIAGDFYRKLIDVCFPKMVISKIRCYELFCIHLGLATSSCVLEHTRRLAATIWDVTGIPNNPMDLL